ncbi:MAG: DUF4870 domain-containing protein [Anaerolineae bacterium]
MSQYPPDMDPFRPEPEPTTGGSTPDTDNDRLMAGLSYLSQAMLPAVLPVILLLNRDTNRRPLVRYHAVHSLALLIATVIYELAVTIVFVILSIVAPCLSLILWLLFLLPALPFLYYAIVAFQGRSPEVPYLTRFLRDNNWL